MEHMGITWGYYGPPAATMFAALYGDTNAGPLYMCAWRNILLI